MIKALTYNIHVGIETPSFKQYISNLWKHAAPSACKINALSKISNFISSYDIVALQEVDLGSLRTSFVNQAHELADSADFPYVACRRNRNMKLFAQHGMAILSRFPINEIKDLPLPGTLSGRGLVCCNLKTPKGNIDVITTHLALSSQERYIQLQYIKLMLQRSENYILMGDLNCELDEIERVFNRNGLSYFQDITPTYPSWRPVKNYDHIFTSKNNVVISYRTVPFICSDHLPVELIIN